MDVDTIGKLVNRFCDAQGKFGPNAFFLLLTKIFTLYRIPHIHFPAAAADDIGFLFI